MSWHKVSIQKNEPGIAAQSVIAFKENVGNAWRLAGMPVDALIYFLDTQGGGCVFLLSPKASAIAKEVLSEFSASVLIEAPDVSGLTPLTL